jgi:hypothetical protein
MLVRDSRDVQPRQPEQADGSLPSFTTIASYPDPLYNFLTSQNSLNQLHNVKNIQDPDRERPSITLCSGSVWIGDARISENLHCSQRWHKSKGQTLMLPSPTFIFSSAWLRVSPLLSPPRLFPLSFFRLSSCGCPMALRLLLLVHPPLTSQLLTSLPPLNRCL